MTMPTEKEKIKIAIVDDHNLFRKGLIKLINLGDKENKYLILFEAEDGHDLQSRLTIRSLPDIILMDIDMPDMDGYSAVAWLKEHYPSIRILVISMFETEEAIERMVVHQNVNGYLSKDIEVEDMHRALESIMQEGSYFSASVARKIANILQNGHNNKGYNKPSLSEKERIFLKMACTDMTYAEIAKKMNQSPKTIDGYRKALFERCNVGNRVALAMYAVKNGLVTI